MILILQQLQVAVAVHCLRAMAAAAAAALAIGFCCPSCVALWKSCKQLQHRKASFHLQLRVAVLLPPDHDSFVVVVVVPMVYCVCARARVC